MNITNKMNAANNENKIKNKERKPSQTDNNRESSKSATGNETVSNEARAVKPQGVSLSSNEVEPLLKKIAGSMNEIAANINDIFDIKSANIFALLKEN